MHGNAPLTVQGRLIMVGSGRVGSAGCARCCGDRCVAGDCVEVVGSIPAGGCV